MPDLTSRANSEEPLIGEYDAIIPQNSPAEATRAPRWALLAMLALGCALWLILAEI